MAVGPLGRASLQALSSLRGKLPFATDAGRGIDFSLPVPPPRRPPPQPYRIPDPVRMPPASQDLSPQTIKFPQLADEVDPVTGRARTVFRDEVIQPVSREQLEAVDKVFFESPTDGYFALLNDIETISNPNQLYQASLLLRRYRPTIGDRLSKTAEKQLEEAARRLGIPVDYKMGAMNLFRYIEPTEPIEEIRRYVSGKEMLDEVLAIARKAVKLEDGVAVQRPKGDAIGALVRLDRYDKGPDGGFIGRAVLEGDINTVADERAITSQVQYWRQKLLDAVGLEEDAFRGIAGLRYADDMPESEAYSRTIAAIRSAKSEDEVAMILSQSRGRISSTSYMDLIEDAADTQVMGISGNVVTQADRRMEWLNEILAEMDRPARDVDVPALQARLERMGAGRISDDLLRPLDIERRSSRDLSVAINPQKPRSSIMDELGGLSGGTGYGRLFRGGQPQLDLPRPRSGETRVSVGDIEFQNAVFTDITLPKGGTSSTLLPRETLDAGTDIQKRWAAKFAEGRATQLMSGDENIVAEAVGAMREATQQGWVSPELLQQLRVVAGRGMRESGAQRRTVGQQRQAARQFQAVAQEGFTLGRPVSSEAWEASTRAPSSQKIFKSNASGSSNKPLSALTMKLRDGRTIEEAYQLDIKGYRSAAEQNPSWSGSNKYKMWMQGKRQPTLNGQTREQLESEYKGLWRNWFAENPDQLELAKRSIGNMTINDSMASPGSISQSKVIRELLGEL